jgi:hypothetical protein
MGKYAYKLTNFLVTLFRSIIAFFMCKTLVNDITKNKNLKRYDYYSQRQF